MQWQISEMPFMYQGGIFIIHAVGWGMVVYVITQLLSCADSN
jgi:hypothetical protein